MSRRWIIVSLLFLLCIALVGTIIRVIPFAQLPFKYDHLVHAHSHVAFQGWVYTAMFLLMTNLFLSREQIKKGLYGIQFMITIPIIIAILVAFALQGYGVFSIAFSTLFQIMNYWFIIRFMRDSKSSESRIAGDISIRFVRTGLWLGLLSTIGPYIVGVLSAKGLENTEAYPSALYFFLHFQYNGWFLFVGLGLFVKCLEDAQVSIDRQKIKSFFLLFTIAVVPAYALSLLGLSYKNYIFIPAILAAIVQMIGLTFFLLTIFRINFSKVSGGNGWTGLFMYAAITAFALKICLQLLSVFPLFEQYAFGNRNIVMAYMHLSLIGVISFILIAILLQKKWLKMWWLPKVGSVLLISGFVITESALVLSGFGIIHPYRLLLVFSAVMALGIAGMLAGVRGQKL